MSIGISLGWNCHPAVHGVNVGIRKRREEGYTTCVFDEMVSNYPGMIRCLEEDFEGFADPQHLELKNMGETMIYNTKYNFWFNHESPGHANLYLTQNWEHGINHFVINNYQYFIERYQRRIENFRNYLRSGNHICFILNRYNTHSIDDIPELNETIRRKYPDLSYEFVFSPCGDAYFVKQHLHWMGFTEDHEEVKRLGV